MIKTPLSTVIGGAFWTPSATIIGGQKTLTQLIKSLFSLGEQGFAYDPNDLTTLYQDAAGTIPVTAAGQPVGLVLDKSKGLVLGNEAVVGGNFESGLIGTLLNSGSSAGTLTLNTVSPISGTQDAKITVTAVDGLNPQLRFNRNVPRIAGALYEFSFDYKVLSGSPFISQIYNGSGTSVVTKALQGSGRFSTRYMAYGAGVSFDQLYFSTNTFDMQIDNVSVKEIRGNHAYQSTSASRPILQRNATTGAYYLAFDGVDDFLQTNNIDFTATDKVSVFAGLNVVADAATGCVIEISTSASGNNGSFGLFKGPAAIQWASRGTMGNLGGQYALPVYPDVLCAKAAINTPLLTVRRNAILNIDDKRTQGTGNYGNYPLYIGRRAGTTLPFNGHLYSLIGIGRLTTDSETITLEKSIAKNTGVTLNV